MTPTQIQAQQQTQNAISAIQTTWDAIFIADVDAQIQAAIARGEFSITAMTNVRVNLAMMYAYYANLGYGVTFPDFLQQNGPQVPQIGQTQVNFTGYNWIQFWQVTFQHYGIQNPARMTISWGQFAYQILPPEESPD